ncbi:RAMP superfamily CRISPR-associated protein [Fischerella thermalis]|uniref:RAMP superfamily CRISPR-associated protein n=1 Tax=Fischerella thermalis TaxID=372787 RepID=UPI000C80B100|nr:RAMP superfamily CRISPR-associated protein [Fischerella thermalis]PLZ05072.1 CRISPR-associated protein Csm3 [Fischerella thermalis WC119]PLZ29477.1 CRISPR-associated protein Csm3 [Fischerella thermalis WC559]PLZ35807.1 CRISPR-associated protein Csm3 [Fischerella thermalis WC558]PLZ43356.1 CRISPR-associated protein Csm3 [Fischerella thermalis WC542]PLZ49504.1 CRISPR-associated protein Csm3 [Fischerella thermalis WC442]
MIYLDCLSSVETDTFKLKAVIDTALCVGAGGSSGSLADKPIVRNAQGQLLIPASQLKGRLRHECEKLARSLGWQIFSAPAAKSLCPTEEQVLNRFRKDYKIEEYRGYHCFVSKIFGDPILPSRVIVDDLICSFPAKDLAEVLRPGVTINRRRRTAEEKKLYLLETSPVNTQLSFEGKIHLLPNCPSYAKPLIIAALHHIHALGGSKSAGLGWLQWKGLPQISSDDAVWLSLLPKAES